MENTQKYEETPVGTFKPGDATNQRQDLLILVLAGRICISDLILVGVCCSITYHLMF